MLFPLIGVGAQVSVQFGVVESLKKMMKKTFADNHGKLPSHFSFLCGFISGLPSAIIVVTSTLFSRLLTTPDLK